MPAKQKWILRGTHSAVVADSSSAAGTKYAIATAHITVRGKPVTGGLGMGQRSSDLVIANNGPIAAGWHVAGTL